MSSKFKKTASRLVLAGVLVLAGLYGGFELYLHIDPSLHPAQAQVRSEKTLLEAAAKQDLKVTAGTKTSTIKRAEVQKWLEPYVRSYTGQEDVRLSERLEDYVVTLATSLNQDPVDAKFVFENGAVKVISPSVDGKALNISKSSTMIRRALLANQSSVVLETDPVAPAITPETISSLKITDELGFGQSSFAGSSAARIQNIKVASKIYNGAIVAPGKTFSFNELLGEVDATGGYAPEKVIKDQKLQYEYGGGICQVSTTLFRAAMAAGLPIVERRGHAFPVAYYGLPGYDATIYPGASDMRFRNDTNGYLLIQTKIVGTQITFNIYGASDGRKITVDGPYQYDVQPDGSMKAYVNRSIAYADGKVKNEVFNSTYKSPHLYTVEKNPYE